MGKNNNALVIIIVVLALLFLGSFGMMGFGGMMRGMYGSNYLCGNVGGIWCYWPNFGFIFGSLFMVAFWVLVILAIIWFINNLNKNKMRRRR